jgi:nitroreductase
MKEIELRRSVRKYTDRPVERGKILKILDAARLAPSGDNTQPWRFLVVESPALKEKIARADHNQKWMLTAPVFVVCAGDLHCRVENPGPVDQNTGLPELKQIIRDTSIAVGYLLLEAEHQGLSTCWTGWYDQREMQNALELPADTYVTGVVTLGYGAEQPAPRPRKPLEELVEFR